ncbi:T9SS type B sorting domain-containing protein, partial [Marinilabilia sp.]
RVAQAATYNLKAWQDNSCFAEASTNIGFLDAPEFDLTDVTACPNETVTIGVENWQPANSSVSSPTDYNWSSADPKTPYSTNPTLNNPPAGKYYLTASDGRCTKTDSVEIAYYTLPTLDLHDTESCDNADFTLELPAGLSSQTASYRWSRDGTSDQGPPNSSWDVDQEGDYTLNITDKNGCSISDGFHLTRLSVPNLDIEADDVCDGDTIRIETPNHSFTSFEWTMQSDPGTVISTLRFARVIQAGTYELQATQDNGCSATASTTVGFLDAPEFKLTDVISCPNDNVSITVENWSPANGTPSSPVSYEWSTADPRSPYSTNPTLDNPPAGKYYLTAFDDRCSKTDSVEIIYHSVQDIQLTDAETCANDPYTLEIPAPLLPTTSSYHWSRNGTPDQGPANSNWDVAQTGYYSLNITDNNGCDIRDSLFLNILTVASLNVPADDICPGDTIILKPDNSAFTEFAWTLQSNPGDTISKSGSIEVTQSGNFVLTAWQDNHCSETTTAGVSILSTPDFDLTDVTGCPNETVSVGLENWQPANGAPVSPVFYEWIDATRGNVISTQPTIENPPAGKYYLTAADERCQHTDSVIVAYHTLPDFQLNDAEACDNETFRLEIPPALTPITNTYRWSRNRTSDEGPVDSNWEVTQSGKYTLTLTDNNGCTSVDSMSLVHLASPVFSLGTDREKCAGDTIMVRTDPFFNRYEWNGNNTDNQPNYLATNTSGAYSLEIWGDNGCSATDQVTISVNPLPSVDLGPDIAGCAGETVTLNAPSYPEIYWSNGTKNATSVTVERGKHTVRVVDDNGCSAKDSMDLTWYPVPSVDLGPDLFICPVEYPINIEAPAGFHGYKWHNGQTNRAITANLLDTLNQVTVTDMYGCKGWDTKVVSTFASPTYSLGPDTSACEPETVVLDAGTEIRSNYAGEEQVSFIQSYRWSNGKSNQTDTVDQSGTMWVEVFDGCFYLRDSIDVTFFPAPEITALDTTYYAQVSVLAENGSQPYYYGLDSENNLQPENTFKNVQNGEHTAYVEDKNGCTALSVFNLNSTYEIDIPDFFTPNNDGFNDTWEIDGLERLPESLVSIFDRYGKLLRQFNAAETISWDGEYLNKPVPSDDYWYVIHLKPIDKLIKGHVTIKR